MRDGEAAFLESLGGIEAGGIVKIAGCQAAVYSPHAAPMADYE